MGQCGCGDLRPLRAFEVGKNKFVVIGYYPGCQECGGVIAHDINFFNSSSNHEKFFR